MTKTKKINRTLHIKESQLRNMMRDNQERTEQICFAIYCTVLRDKMGFAPDDVLKAYNYMRELIGEIKEKRIRGEDLTNVLWEEGNIIIHKGEPPTETE